MADEASATATNPATEQPAAPVATEAASAPAPEKVDAADAKPEASEESKSAEGTTAAPAAEKPAGEGDVEMKDAEQPAPAAEAKPEEPTKTEEPAASKKPEAGEESTEAAAEGATGEAGDAAAADKTKARRKSNAASDNKGKKLNKKASKAKILHTDAKPGDHFFAKLKGFPPWPIVIASEDMLPNQMLRARPVTAARADGTYRDGYQDGGKKIADRTFPVMYLHTNEFGWTSNSDLSELDATTVRSLITSKMRKDLQQAHELAEEAHDLEYYKNVLREFEQNRLKLIEEQAEKARKKEEAAMSKKKKKTEAAEPKDDGDIEMADAEEGDASATKEKKATKKRKADDDSKTPQRSDSVKKPKIKLTNSSTPKAANGASTPKSAKETTTLKVKSKSAKGAKDGEAKKEAAVVKEPELTPEEKHARKEKEILFLRHRLQKGLLIRDQEPKEDEMRPMSEFLGKLETFPDLEVAIIRATKINKVLKGILKLGTIPKEEEYKFKPRSQALLDKWNKILSASEGAGSGSTPAAVNGAADEAADKDTNGVKASETETKPEEKETEAPAKEEPAVAAEPAAEKEAPAAESASAAEPAAVESTA